MKYENTVQVWDILVRLFHWSLVVSFAVAYISDDDSLWHIYSGYIVLGLIVFRVLWGVIGTKYARFSDFVYSAGSVSKYLKKLITNKPKRYIGHNPAGGWMIMALMLSLFVVTVSGLKVYAIEEGRGPLANVSDTEFSLVNMAYADSDEDDEGEKEEDEFWEELHEVSANFTLLLIFLHVLGVIVSGRLYDENLVKAMLTGRKKA